MRPAGPVLVWTVGRKPLAVGWRSVSAALGEACRMTENVLDLADRLWRGEVATGDYHPFSHLGGLAEICEGVAFVPSFANVSAFTTADGLVLVDTASSFVAAAVHKELRRWTSQRLNTAVYSHGHIDHVFGVPVWEDESDQRGWPAPVVIAHEALPARFDRYIMTAGYNEVINQRQFGVPGLRWPVEYRYPDRTYRDELALEVGGTGFELRHEKGETDDHTVTWVPDRRVLCCGDLFIWASPNAGNPQKVQRYPKEWAAALRQMLELGPEYLLPGHGLPVVGADRVSQALTDTADLLDSLVDQTLAVMNGGGRLDDAIHGVVPPAHLMDRPYLRPVYDEPEFIVHTVWRQYGGWWDGNPASLKPAPERALAVELAALAGGAQVLADRALALVTAAPADAWSAPSGPDAAMNAGGARAAGRGDGPGAEAALRLAGHLAELAWLAAPGDRGIARIRQQVYTARADAATSTMATGVFRWAAHESDSAP
ncbi:MAG TPA: alkyl sulfatase dimerization domain-containing protein [Streptosporangiaceae bacterium]|nr:alkyl sulfatase dimerization domain-containing protein [Streptosporangiaceae bacterium]